MTGSAPAIWLTAVAWFSLGLAFMSAVSIVYDIHVRGFHQKMRVMESVWPVTALYAGPLAWWAYARWGRPQSPRWQNAHGEPARKSFAATTCVAVSHCGAGCTLGGIIGTWAIFAGAVEIAGKSLWPEYAADYVGALVFGIAFQYWAIAPMRGLGFRDGIIAALKADTLSLTSFEIGMFGWMAMVQLAWFPAAPLRPDDAAYWFMMQIGMGCGFVSSYPMNAWLLEKGIKEAM
jgi:hypothetical protein